MALTPEQIEDRIRALENRNTKLEELRKLGRSFTTNPLALATDLDDLGSVKTHLDFEEPTLTPATPPADVLRLYAVDGTATGGQVTVLAYVASGGNVGIIDSGAYTPTLTNGTNVAASTASEASWMRVGQTVTVAGKFLCDPTAADTVTKLGISIPIASDFAAEENCGGATGCRTFEGSGLVFADVANDRAEAQFFPSDLNDAAWGFTFTYQVR